MRAGASEGETTEDAKETCQILGGMFWAFQVNGSVPSNPYQHCHSQSSISNLVLVKISKFLINHFHQKNRFRVNRVLQDIVIKLKATNLTHVMHKS